MLLQIRSRHGLDPEFLAVLSFNRGEQPSFGEGPGALHRPLGDAQEFGDLAVAQSNEEAEFNHFGFLRIDRSEFVENFVDLKQGAAILAGIDLDIFERDG